MIIDGKKLARVILDGVAAESAELLTPPHLTVFTCVPNFETRKFLALKQKQASLCGVTLVLKECNPDVTPAQLAAAIDVALPDTDGIIIQLPFPTHLDTSDLVALIPTSHDVDAFSYDGGQTKLLPPVVGAIDVISQQHNVAWIGKNVVVVGNGRLVGSPATMYAQSQGAEVTVVVKDTLDQDTIITEADILILGAGVPGLITENMVKAGVVIFDAGTSEEGGMLVGDADSTVAGKASLLTPVPGGIGPLTIAILLRNVLYLAIEHRKNLHNMV